MKIFERSTSERSSKLGSMHPWPSSLVAFASISVEDVLRANTAIPGHFHLEKSSSIHLIRDSGDTIPLDTGKVTSCLANFSLIMHMILSLFFFFCFD